MQRSYVLEPVLATPLQMIVVSLVLGFGKSNS